VLEQRTLTGPKAKRYAGWSKALGTGILDGSRSLVDLERMVAAGEIDPRPTSGQQELLEGLVNRRIWAADRAASRGPKAP